MRPEDRVKRWLRASVLDSPPYRVADAAGLIKLDAMENPYPWPETLREAWLEELRHIALNRYPDPDPAGLKQRLRAVFSIPDGLEILLGNGSDEIIQILALAVAAPGVSMLSPDPSFVMYRVIAGIAGLDYTGVPLGRVDFSLDEDAMLSAVQRRKPALVFVSWPNNPTGNLFDPEVIESIVRAAPGIVVIDEAYHAFAGASLMSLLERYDHVLIMRTLSKLGLAGLRLGFLVGRDFWLRELEKLRLPYNVGVLTQASVSFVLDHIDVLREQTQHLCRDRERLFQRLSVLPGITVWPSAANFLLFKTDPPRAAEVHAELRARGVLIKSLNGVHPLLAGCLRVTVGSGQENQAFVDALTAVLE